MLILIPAVASALIRNLLDGDFSLYMSYTLLGIAAPTALVLLFYSIRFGTKSWSWSVVTMVSVVVGLIGAFM